MVWGHQVRIGLLALLALAGSLAVATGAHAAVGDLSNPRCIANTGTTICDSTGGQALALRQATGVAVSPDGTSAYVASLNSDAIAVFDRGATGSLSFRECIAATFTDLCDATGGRAPGFDEPGGVAVSPDGTSVYVASPGGGAITTLDRAPDGSLSNPRCIARTGAATCDASGGQAPGLSGATGVAVSPDGGSVYVASRSSDAIAAFTRAANGNLAFSHCIANTGVTGCDPTGGQAPGLGGATGVAVSPDGASVYVASGSSDAVAAFNRAANGTLAFSHCIAEVGSTICDATGGQAPGLDGATGVAVSPDGGSVYVAAELGDALVAFDRAASGALSNPRCIADLGLSTCDSTGGQAPGMRGARGVAVSPDSASVYVAARNALVTIDRAPGGALSSPRCVADAPLVTCDATGGQAPGLRGGAAVATSLDGASVYVAASRSNAIAAFDRELPPPPPDSEVTIEIRGKKLKLNRKGVAIARLACPAEEASGPCEGRLVLETRGQVRFKGKRRRVTLAKARFSVEAGEVGRVRLRLGKPKLRLVRNERRARRARAAANVRDQAGNQARVAKRLALSVKKAGRR